MRICVLASSSSGNSTFIATARTRILIDCGLSRRETVARLAAIGEEATKLDAIFITHEHSDHVCGLPMMAKHLRIPVYLTHRTAPMIDWGEATPCLETFQAGAALTIGDVEVSSFTVPHDAVDPVGYVLRSGGVTAAVATDLGYIPDSIKHHLRYTDFLLLEANHDLEMLKVGPYPWSLKQRVMGRNGHLSNDVACEFIRDYMSMRTRTLVLGHLSEQNNYPDLVRIVATRALESRGLETALHIADPRRATAFFEL